MKNQGLLWLILFLAWGLPLTYYRSRFIKLVYLTDSWWINLKPVFSRELKALFTTLYPGNRQYIRFRNFYRLYLVIYLLLFICYLCFGIPYKSSDTAKMEKVEVGSQVPLFSLPDQDGNMFDLRSVVGKKKLVIYFYPMDDSPGCTKEACYFRDQFEVFREAGAMIIGISGQSVESHRKFAEKYRLSFTLLSDEGNKIRKIFGVPTNVFGLLPGRVTYVTDSQGKLVYIFNSQSQAKKHVDEALRILKEIH